MKIIGIHIDGFGMFHNLEAKSIPPAFSVLYGENEAGKTTFTAFIRAILFGFPAGRSSENAYPALAGGRHGGSINLSMASGEQYNVERRPGPRGGNVVVTSQDGSSHGEELLRQLVGSATRDLYRNIFGFSLHELQNLEALDDEKVKATIYSAGLGIRVSLPSIETAFSNEAAALFKTGGRTPVMNKVLKELEEVRGKISSRYQDSARYDELLGSRLGRESQLTGLRDDQKTIGTINGRATRVLSVWEEWVEFHDAEQALAKLPEIKSFPVDGLSRLDALEEKLESVTEELDHLGLEINSLEEKQRSILLNDDLLGRSVDVEQLQRGREKYDSAVADLPLREQDAKRAWHDVKDSLRQLGPEWDEQKLGDFDDSIATREAIREYGERLQASQSDLRALRVRQGQMGRASRGANQKLTRAEAHLNQLDTPAETDRTILRDRMGKVRGVTTMLRDRIHLAEEKSNLKDRIGDLNAAIILLEETTDPPSRGFGTSLGLMTSVVALIAAPLLWYNGQTFLSLATAALAIGLFVTSYTFRKKLSAGLEDMRRKRNKNLASVNSRKEDASAKDVQTTASLTTLEQSLVRQCAELEIPVPHSLSELDRHIEITESLLEALRDWATSKNNAQELKTELETIENESTEVNNEVTKAEQTGSTARREWNDWLKSTGLTSTVSPDGALEILNAIRTGKQRLTLAVGSRERVETINTYIQKYSTAVQDTASSCGVTVSHEMTSGLMADQLAKLIESEKGKEKDLGTLKELLAKARQRRKVLEGKKGRFEQGLADLFAEAEVESADAFTTRGDNWTKRLDLEQKCSSLRMAIEKVGGVGKQGDEFMTLLRGADPVEQRTTKAATDSQIEEIDNTIERTIRELATVDEQIRVLESGTETSDLRLREQCLIEQLSLNAEKWSLLAVAQCLLARTRDKYERERQPSVIRDALSFFEPITGGRYDRILAEPGKVGFHVLDRNGSRKGVEELSGGTREQLYFALRLGLIREFGKRLEPLPVILDDIFVNFDPMRAKAALHATFGLSKTHQVLLLTCHPETVRLICAEAPTTPVLAFDHDESAVKSVPANDWLRSYSFE